MVVRLIKDEREDKEWIIYNTVLEDVKTFLGENNFSRCKFLPIANNIKIRNGENAEEGIVTRS